MKKSITKWAQGISTGILATALSLMCGCNNSVQTDKTGSMTSKGSINGVGKKILEGENCVISLPQGVKLEMVWVNPGTFTMGSPESELGRRNNEAQHQVTLARGFWLGQYEVTQGQYKAIMGSNPSKFVGDDLPVEEVSWDDAMEFCRKLTEQERVTGRLPEGYGYTLPTEAQWEYACRAETTTSLNSGKNVMSAEGGEKGICNNLNEVGWYRNNSDNTTHPVGQKQPNAWKMYDMHGNVEEWCLDWYGDYQTLSVTDTKGPETGVVRVLRGGGWYYDPRDCRSARRNSHASGHRSYSVGFRLALVALPQK